MGAHRSCSSALSGAQATASRWNSRARTTSVSSRLLRLLALGAAGVAAGAGSAHAATVTTTVCGAAVPNHAFAPYSEDPGYSFGADNCTVGASAGAGANHAGGFIANAIPGTAFVDYHIRTSGPSLPGNAAQGWQQVIDGLDTADNYQGHYRCGYNTAIPACLAADTFANGAAPAQQLRLLLYCALAPACAGPAFVDILPVVLVIEDDNPAAVLARTGPVWTTGVWHHAADVLAGTIGNGAEGIKNVTVTLDGVSSLIPPPACDYSSLRVCPDAPISTPLNGAVDGTHHLLITATTAAGITTTVHDDPGYQIDSTAPSAPLGVALDAPGDRYSPAAARTLSWTNPTGQVAPITHAVIHVCRVDSGQCRDETADGPNVQQATITPWGGGGAYRLTVALQDQAGNINDGPGGQSAPVLLRYDQRPYSVLIASAAPLQPACGHAPAAHHPSRALSARARRLRACRVIARHPRTVVRARFGARITVYAALSDAADHPLANQPIQILQQLRGPATTFTPVGTATTDAGGGLSYVVTAGPSRTLRLAYPGTDAIKAALADINIRVPAYSSFHVDRRTAHLGQRVVFSGQVKGGPIPPGGLAVQLEGRDYRTGWIPVSPAGKLRTDRSGRWHYSFAAHRQSGASFTYPFRLAILADPLFPYSPSRTQPKLVTILNP